VPERHACTRVVRSGHLRGPQAGMCQKQAPQPLTPSTQRNAQPGMARADALPSSARHIHVARPSYNTDDRRFKAPRQRLTCWLCGASSRSYGPPARSGVQRRKLVLPQKHFRQHFFNCGPFL